MHFILPGGLLSMRHSAWRLRQMIRGRKIMLERGRRASSQPALSQCFPTAVSVDSLKGKLKQTPVKSMTTVQLPTNFTRDKNLRVALMLLLTGSYPKPWTAIMWADRAKVLKTRWGLSRQEPWLLELRVIYYFHCRSKNSWRKIFPLQNWTSSIHCTDMMDF